MLEEPKKWAQARMAPQTWERLRRWAGSTAVSLGQTGAALQRWTSVGSEHVTSARAARMEPWRLVAAIFVVLIVSLLMSPLPTSMAMSVVPLVFLLCVGFCTSMADWVGGVAATITALICMDLIFFGAAGELDAFSTAPLMVVMLAFVLVAVGSIVLIERMKYDRANARLEAASLRAANTALSAVEIAAAQRPLETAKPTSMCFPPSSLRWPE
jgi:K+-sensing histidine kinase KdpD